MITPWYSHYLWFKVEKYRYNENKNKKGSPYSMNNVRGFWQIVGTSDISVRNKWDVLTVYKSEKLMCKHAVKMVLQL